MKENKYPRSFSHIGITVPDINKAVEFYQEVMGWYVIMSPSKVTKEKDTAIGQMYIDVSGEDGEEFLFNIVLDPGETNDLKESESEKFSELKKEFQKLDSEMLDRFVLK